MTTTTAFDARWAAVKAGLFRGWIETRQAFTERIFLLGHLLGLGMNVFILLRMGGKTVPGTDFALGAMVLPSLIGVSIAFGGFAGPASVLAVDREDGTLLRAKATPNGMLGYLVGKVVMFALTTLFSVVSLIIPGVMVAGDLIFDARTWLLLAPTFVAGLMATVPIAVALGSLMKSSLQSVAVLTGTGLLVIPSGIFFPITRLPAWMQWLGQAFPFYWVGLGARSALLPAKMVAVEIGQSWRTLEMFAVLGLWAAIGMLLAPILLRRTARRQSGSTLAATRDRIMSKGY